MKLSEHDKKDIFKSVLTLIISIIIIKIATK